MAGAVLACALVVWLAVRPSGGPTVDGGKYLSFTGCLLTDSRGLSAEPASAAWAGLQQAAAGTRMQTEYLAVPASAASAEPYLASLVVRKCGLVVAAGPAQAAAVRAESGRFAGVRFVVAGAAAGGGPNVSAAPGGPSAVTSLVARRAEALANRR